MKRTFDTQKGDVSPLLIGFIVTLVFFLAAGGFAIWAYINYREAQTAVDSKIASATAEAKKQQSDDDEKKFAEREKEPNRTFVGPNDYGRLTFDYPKTWSVYEASDVTRLNGSSPYKAFLHPIVVPSVEGENKYAVHVTIEQTPYDQVVKQYEELIKKGDLKSSPTTSNGLSGLRVEGTFAEKKRGALVIYKIRDKTMTLQTDADVFKPDFENIIKTIKFNQ